jgi:hypothetical protein
MLLSGYYAVQKVCPTLQPLQHQSIRGDSLMESVLYIGQIFGNHVKGLLHRK